jgi:protein-disulfide isomerase
VAKSQPTPRGRPSPAPRGGRSPLTPFYVILGIIAVAGLGVLLYQVLGRAEPALEPIPVAMDPAELARAPGVAIGPDDAPVVIYEFADFQCPGCQQFATFVAPLVKQRYVEQGLVRYVYYDFPLTQIHPHAFLASRAGRCANEQGRFWEYHDLLYGRQARWASVRNPTDLFIEYAGEVGLDRRQFTDCLRSDRYALEITQNMRLGESLGVGGTPTLFVNGKRLPSVPSLRELEAIIQQEMGTSPAAGATAPAVAPDQTGSESPGMP